MRQLLLAVAICSAVLGGGDVAAEAGVLPTQSGKTQQTQETSGLSLQELRSKYADSFYFSAKTDSKQVALTFDDAPDPLYTPQILQILEHYQIAATFFIVGERVERYPLMVEWIHQQGHAIGNHSYDHAYLPNQSLARFGERTYETQTLIANLIGYQPRMFRPPYGAIDEDKLLWLRDNGLIVVNWNVDSEDWRGLDADKVMTNVMRDMRPGSIVLQHAGGGKGQRLEGTVEALPMLIEQLMEQGYQFATVPDLLDNAQRESNEAAP